MRRVNNSDAKVLRDCEFDGISTEHDGEQQQAEISRGVGRRC